MSKPSLLARQILERTVEGETPSDIADRYGIQELEVVSTVKELLATGDVYTDLEERRMLVYKLKALLKRAESFLDYTDIRTAPKLLDSANNLIKSIAEMQEKQQVISDEETRKLALQQAALIMEVVQASYQRARDLLAREYPQVDVAKLDQVFQGGVKELAASYSA